MMKESMTMARAKLILVVLMMAAATVGTIAATAYPAQAQQRFDVNCSGFANACQGAVGNSVQSFDCDPLIANKVGQSSQCTNLTTGETFACVATFVGPDFTSYSCTSIPPPTLLEAPPEAPPVEIIQEIDQEAESGDVDQSFEVSSSGDNSNQCAGIQGVANTGNAQNAQGSVQFDFEADDFEFEEVGSDIAVSPVSTTTCDQQVNQAASASG